MDKTVKYIQLGFENTEVINIDIMNIEYMRIYGIGDCDTINRFDKRVERQKCCQSLRLCINKQTNTKYPTYGGISNLTLFERLFRYNDIVDVTYLNANKDAIETINLPWKDKMIGGEENINQHSKIDKEGNIEIVVKNEK